MDYIEMKHPVQWPRERPREEEPRRSRFTSMAIEGARAELHRELTLLGAEDMLCTSNLKITREGRPFVGQRNTLESPVAVYFTLNGRQLCMSCDRWLYLWENMHAIGLSVQAMRGLERWGSREMVEGAFAGFAALPPSSPWWEVFGVEPTATLEEVKAAYNAAVKRTHPDTGGDAAQFRTVHEAYADYRRS